MLLGKMIRYRCVLANRITNSHFLIFIKKLNFTTKKTWAEVEDFVLAEQYQDMFWLLDLFLKILISSQKVY